MSTFFERVVNEQNELQTKISGLDSFIKSDKYNEVSYTQRHLLAIQLNTMMAYNQVLLARISELQLDESKRFVTVD